MLLFVAAERRVLIMFENLFSYLEFPFVRYALITGVMIYLCSSLRGVTIV